MISGNHVGHIRDELSNLHYLGFYGASTDAQSLELEKILQQYDDNRYGIHITNDSPPHLTLSDSANWSTIDLDDPYTTCSNCHIPMEYSCDPEESQPPLLCSQCTYIQDFLSSIV